jgi:preprotein translocase subunit SecD
MYRCLCSITALLICAVTLQAQSRFTINAASDVSVPGWQKMEIEGGSVWVNPTPALTSADIQGAEPAADRNRGNFVKVMFTEAGAKKMQDLTTAQMNKPIAMLLDGKVLSAPKVRSVISRDGIITGPGPSGLTTEQVRTILTSVNQKQK